MHLRTIAALFAAGLGIGALTHGSLSDVFADLTLAVFIPPLIFEASWHLRLDELRAHWRSVALLIVPGVPITAAIVTFAAMFSGLPLLAALALGAALSATDPIAIVAIFRRLQIPRSLVAIVEGESLFNDAVALVLFRAVVAGAAAASFGGSLAWLAGYSLLGSLLSLLVGIVAGWLCGVAVVRTTNRAAQVAASIVGAYGTYILCDQLHWSGIFAVIAFGMTMRQVSHEEMHVRVALDRSWHKIGIGANVLLFVLMGAALDPLRLAHVPLLIALTLAAVLLARAVLAYVLLAFVHIPATWKNVVRVAGMRGALSLAMALALPPSFPYRGAVQLATFSVVIGTILIGTLTLEPRLRRVEF